MNIHNVRDTKGCIEVPMDFGEGINVIAKEKYVDLVGDVDWIMRYMLK